MKVRFFVILMCCYSAFTFTVAVMYPEIDFSEHIVKDEALVEKVRKMAFDDRYMSHSPNNVARALVTAREGSILLKNHSDIVAGLLPSERKVIKVARDDGAVLLAFYHPQAFLARLALRERLQGVVDKNPSLSSFVRLPKKELVILDKSKTVNKKTPLVDKDVVLVAEQVEIETDEKARLKALAPFFSIDNVKALKKMIKHGLIDIHKDNMTVDNNALVFFDTGDILLADYEKVLNKPWYSRWLLKRQWDNQTKEAGFRALNVFLSRDLKKDPKSLEMFWAQSQEKKYNRREFFYNSTIKALASTPYLAALGAAYGLWSYYKKGANDESSSNGDVVVGHE